MLDEPGACLARQVGRGGTWISSPILRFFPSFQVFISYFHPEAKHCVGAEGAFDFFKPKAFSNDHLILDT